MAREEEIKRMSRIHCTPNDESLLNKGFIRGVQWADEHPKDNLVDIDKVCKFIENKAYIYVEFSALGVYVDTDSLIKDLRKAMKGE